MDRTLANEIQLLQRERSISIHVMRILLRNILLEHFEKQNLQSEAERTHKKIHRINRSTRTFSDGLDTSE